MSTPLTVAEPDSQWWCECPEMRRPHVHCPNWGGKGGSTVLTIPVDPETGETVRDGSA